MKTSSKALLGIGAGIAAIATATYYFKGPHGKEHSKKMKGWMIKMKGEIIDRIEDAKDLTKEKYEDIIDTVASTSSATLKASKEEINDFADELKSHWDDIVDSGMKSVKKVGTKVKKAARKSSR
jgi:gas vesicle protein